MSKRVWFPITELFLITVFLLVSCGPPATEAPAATEPPATELPVTEPPATEPPATEPPTAEVPSFTFSLPVAQIESITYSPAKFIEDENLTYTVNYENTSLDEDLADLILEINYDPSHLTYSDSSPAESSSESGHLNWNLGTLNHQTKSAVTVTFIVDQLPSELTLDVKISGKDSQEISSSDSRLIVIYPVQEAENVYPKAEVYPEGVSVYWPEQDSGKELHSERRADDVSIVILPEAAEFYGIIRPITYIDIFDQDQELISNFSPAIKLTINYNDEDSKQAVKEDNLIILLYDSGDNAWIPCDGEFGTETTACSKTEILTTVEGNGFLSVDISRWTSGQGIGKRRVSQ